MTSNSITDPNLDPQTTTRTKALLSSLSHMAFIGASSKNCVTQLLSTTYVACFRHIRQQEIEKLLKSLLESSSEGGDTNFSRELVALTNNILCQMAISTTYLDNVK
ncbi:hypothetical protein VNO80_23102 [Phaseolus coccineus]|uniref:Uncharacterized protein n=1 Tax=Phaseolus coccineus TaxID=3886 RepID=A0AAN9QUY3_PHACN